MSEPARDENHPKYLGDCEGCSKHLFIGDKGYSYDDGPIVCAECAPSWEAAEENWRANEDADPDDMKRFEDALAAHLASGGSMDDLIIRDL